ncbi:hypothetical protein NC651_012211 [Populus alba x Populus x berolinensis]|nr:hypothetical protein NC651_012211 [Populus alba x Populus x berolinensis]
MGTLFELEADRSSKVKQVWEGDQNLCSLRSSTLTILDLQRIEETLRRGYCTSVVVYESKFIESIVKEIADKLNLSLPHVRPSALPLSSALRPPSYFFGLLREWRRSFFQTPSLFLFFFDFTTSL